MNSLNQVVKAIYNVFIKPQFCKHDFVLIGKLTGRNKETHETETLQEYYRCKKCGKNKDVELKNFYGGTG